MYSTASVIPTGETVLGPRACLRMSGSIARGCRDPDGVIVGSGKRLCPSRPWSFPKVGQRLPCARVVSLSRVERLPCRIEINHDARSRSSPKRTRGCVGKKGSGRGRL